MGSALKKESAPVTRFRYALPALVRLNARLTLPVLALWLTTMGAFALPQLTLKPGTEQLPQSFQTGQTITYTLEYKDPNGDPVQLKDAVFIDKSPTGTALTHAAATIDGSDFVHGVDIVWTVTGFTQGGHTGYFEIKGLTGTARYPEKDKGEYTFDVESLSTKYITLVVGMLIGLGGIPFISYLLFRSLNRRGDPSRAARVGLLFGMLAVCALFIYLFAGVYSILLVYTIPIIALIAGLIVIFGRR